MHQQIGKELLEKYSAGTATESERLIVEEWYAKRLFANLSVPQEEDYASIKAEVWASLDVQDKKAVKPVRLWSRYISIAAAIATIVFGIWFFNNSKQESVLKKEMPELVGDVAPGGYGATLTLASGKKIRLADASAGELAKEAGISITKTADGKLVYSIEESVADPNAINKFSTDRGETYEVHLPDGSKVHLNAASSLTYKTSLLEGGRRIVKLNGEGYFEVAKDAVHPFVVKTNNQEVQVLGTHFNISSYDNDAVEKTTLIEGSVKMTAAGVSRLLRPGQQTRLQNGKMTIVETDTDLAVAWTKNEFVFESERIEDVMKMVERWYNVEVIYVGDKTNERFSGGVSRFDNVSKVLEIVEITGKSHFEIKGRKIYVSK